MDASILITRVRLSSRGTSAISSQDGATYQRSIGPTKNHMEAPNKVAEYRYNGRTLKDILVQLYIQDATAWDLKRSRDD